MKRRENGARVYRFSKDPRIRFSSHLNPFHSHWPGAQGQCLAGHRRWPAPNSHNRMGPSPRFPHQEKLRNLGFKLEKTACRKQFHPLLPGFPHPPHRRTGAGCARRPREAHSRAFHHAVRLGGHGQAFTGNPGDRDPRIYMLLERRCGVT